jgi:outer membrane protein assembly factor BamB
MGSPVIDGDTVFVAVGNRMFSLDRTSGNQKWRFPLVEGVPGYFRAGPVLVDGVLAAAADNGLVYGVDADTGQSKWAYPSPVPIIGQPIAVGRMIVLQLTDNTLMAIKAEDGTPAWSNPYRVFAGVNGGMAAHQDSLYYMTQAGDLVCMSVNTTKHLWTKRFPVIFGDSKPVIFGDLVYLNNGTWISALSAITGSPRWQQNVGEQLAYSPAVSPSGTFVVSLDGKAYCFDYSTGRAKYRQPVELNSVPAVSPSAVDAHFLAPTTNGALNLLDATSGEIVWSFLIRPLVSGLTVSGSNAGGGGTPGRGGAPQGGGGTEDVKVLAIPASGQAVLAGQTLFVQAQDGSLLAFDRKMGVDKTGPAVEMLWPYSGEMVSGQPPLEMIFKITDEATGVNENTLKIMVAGSEVEYDYGRDGFAVVRVSLIGKNKPLRNGRNEITISVSDWMGNKTESYYSLTIDNTLPPLATPGRAQTGGVGAPGSGGGGGRGGRGGGGRGGGG